MVRQFSMEYSATMGIGGAFGPFAQFLLTFLPDFSFEIFGKQLTLNEFTYPAFFALALLAFHFFLVSVYFQDPYKKGFYKTEEEKNSDAQRISIQSIKNDPKEKLIINTTESKAEKTDETDNFNRYEDIRKSQVAEKDEQGLVRHIRGQTAKKKVSSLQNVKIVLGLVVFSLCVVRITTDTIFSCTPFYIGEIYNSAIDKKDHSKDRLTSLIFTIGQVGGIRIKQFTFQSL
jgi:hypothetical protein